MKTGEITLDSRWARWLTIHLPWMDDSETITSVTTSVEAVSADATDVDTPECTVEDNATSGDSVLVLVRGGVDGTSYHVNVATLTSRQQRGYDTIVVNIDNGGT